VQDSQRVGVLCVVCEFKEEFTVVVDAEKLLAVDYVTSCVLPIKAGAGMSDHHSLEDSRRKKTKRVRTRRIEESACHCV